MHFITDFSGGDENPLSDGGNWAKAANPWKSYQRVSGICKPVSYNGDPSDDTYALLQRDVADPVEVIGTVYRNGTADSGERSILLRANDNVKEISCYACWYHSLGSSSTACGIGRWYGLNSYDEMSTFQDCQGALADGDQLRATITGYAVAFYWRRPPSETWILVASGTDGNSNFATGRVGLSNYLRSVNGDIANVGWRAVEVTAAGGDVASDLTPGQAIFVSHLSEY